MTMTSEEVCAIEANSPVLLEDGTVGLLIGYPFSARAEALVQVAGEEEARRILPAQLRKASDADAVSLLRRYMHAQGKTDGR